MIVNDNFFEEVDILNLVNHSFHHLFKKRGNISLEFPNSLVLNETKKKLYFFP